MKKTSTRVEHSERKDLFFLTGSLLCSPCRRSRHMAPGTLANAMAKTWASSFVRTVARQTDTPIELVTGTRMLPAILAAIENRKSMIYIMQSHLNRTDVTAALCRKSSTSGVRIYVILDQFSFTSGSRPNQSSLPRELDKATAEIRVHQLENRYQNLHAKTMLIDGMVPLLVRPI